MIGIFDEGYPGKLSGTGFMLQVAKPGYLKDAVFSPLNTKQLACDDAGHV